MYIKCVMYSYNTTMTTANTIMAITLNCRTTFISCPEVGCNNGVGYAVPGIYICSDGVRVGCDWDAIDSELPHPNHIHSYANASCIQVYDKLSILFYVNAFKFRVGYRMRLVAILLCPIASNPM